MKTNEIYWVIATSKTLDDLQLDGEYFSLEEAKEFAEKVELSYLPDKKGYNKIVVRSSDSDNDLFTKELE